MAVHHVVVYGVGGVGGFIGGRIARFVAASPEAGATVTFVARGAHLREIREHGLTLKGGDGHGVVCRPTVATEGLEGLPPPDLVFVCVKSYDLGAVSEVLARSMKADSVIIPLLNGVDIAERIRGRLDRGIILPSCIYVGTHIERPGTVTHKGGEGRMLIGRDPLHPAFSVREVLDFLVRAGLPFTWLEDSMPAIWEKYIFIAAFGLVTASHNKNLGEIMADATLTALTRSVMEEVHGIAVRKGISLPADIVDLSLAKGGGFPFETKTSYQRDVEQHDKADEGDLFGGTIVRLGREVGIPTPVTQSLYRLIEDRKKTR